MEENIKIHNIKNKNGVFYPRTHIEAVINSNEENLSDILENHEKKINSNFSNSLHLSEQEMTKNTQDTVRKNIGLNNIEIVEIDNLEDEIIFEDKNGKTIGVVNEEGIDFKSVKSNGIDVLTEHQSLENYALKTDVAILDSIEPKVTEIDFEEIGSTVEEVIFGEENDPYVIIDKNGIKAKSFMNIDGIQMKDNDWYGKIYSTYGDSVTSIDNGSHMYPYDSSLIKNKWGVRIADYFGMSEHYGRGIGGQKFAWGNQGGSITWVTPLGDLIARNDNFKYDNFDGVSYPSGVTAEMEADGAAIRIRGCACSWRRIIKMYPEEIKDKINLITIMFHNDGGTADKELSWVEGSEVDPEWKTSEFYSVYGGDYNISTVRGGIASTIMKLQAWMPNAVLVLCTPISGEGVSGEMNKNLRHNDMELVASIVKDMARIMSIPCIDVYATDGINGLNRLRYIADGIHPYLEDGKKMIARAIIGGLKTILPNFD